MHEAVRSYEHRDIQIDCLEAIKKARSKGHPSGLVNMATGLGKTYVAAMDVKDFLRDDPSARALYLCHNTDILRQARGTFEEVIGEDVGHGYVFEGQSNDQQQLVYASFQTLNGRGKLYQALDPTEFDYVIDDESHHASARTHKEVLSYLKPQFMLGLSATPERRDGRDILDIFGIEIYRKTLEEALAEGLLTPVVYKTFTDHLQQVGDIAKLIEQIGMGQLNKTLFIPRRDEEIAEILFDEMVKVRNLHAVVFGQSIEHAERMASLLPDAVAIHSKLSPGRERELKNAFKYGEIPVAVVVDKFNEGVDLPSVNFLGALRSTTSFRIWRQQLGRGLRRYPDKDEVRVVDLAPSFERIQMVLDLEAGIRKAKKGERTETEPRELNIGVNFDFTQEARDVVELIKQARAGHEASRDRYKRPFEDVREYDVPYETEKGEFKEVRLEPKDILILKAIWSNEEGRITTRELQQLHQQQFREKIQQKELGEYLSKLVDRKILQNVAFVRGSKGSKLWRLSSGMAYALSTHAAFRVEYDQAIMTLHQTIANNANQAYDLEGTLPDSFDLVDNRYVPHGRIKVLLHNSTDSPDELDNVVLDGPLGYQGEFEKSDVTGPELAKLIGENIDTSVVQALTKAQISTTIHIYRDSVVRGFSVSGSRNVRNYGETPYLQHFGRHLTPGEINQIARKLSQYPEILLESTPIPEYKDSDHRAIYHMLGELDQVRRDHTQSTFLEDPSEPADMVRIDYTRADSYEAGLILGRFEDYPDLLDRLKGNPSLIEALERHIDGATWRSEEYRNRLRAKIEEIKEDRRSEK